MTVRSRFWWRWLVVATAVVAIFGALLVLAPALMQRVLGALYFPPPAGPPSMDARGSGYVMFTAAVLGAVMIGWAVMLFLVLLGPFRRGEREGWTMLAVSLAAWFVPDTVFSLVSGFWQNAVLNAVLGILFAVPLAATFATFRHHPRQEVGAG